MPEQFHAEELVGMSNRRSFPRQQVRSLSYIDLGDGNGGIVLNLSEGGLALQAVTSLMEDHLPRVRFQLSESRSWLETSGRITWTSESRKVVGIEFVNLPDTARNQIKEWISSGDSPIELPAEAVAAPSEKIAFPSTTTDSLLFMPVPARTIGIAASKDTFQDAANPAQPAPMFSDGASTTSSQQIPAEAPRNSWTLNLPQPEPRHRLVALFVVLAVVSLIVGWAAGRAGLAQMFKRANVTSASTRPSPSATAAPSLSTGTKVSQIEIQGADNRSRLISFDGPLPPDATVLHGTGQHLAPGKKTFQVWVLSSPVRSQGASVPGAKNENPPVLTNVPASSTNILPSSGGFEARNSISAPPPPPPQKAPERVGDLQRGRLIHRVEPLYPAGALENGVEGTVKLHAVIGDDGSVKTLESVGGPDLLIDSAMNAVRQWRYTPTLLDGKPIETDQDVFIVFRLPTK
jgi:Gram-negative bacterial TonB protein C-terminal/PilZ domain